MRARLSPLVAGNLRVEAHGLPMNVAALVVREAAPLLDGCGQLAVEAIRARIERRGIVARDTIQRQRQVPPADLESE